MSHPLDMDQDRDLLWIVELLATQVDTLAGQLQALYGPSRIPEVAEVRRVIKALQARLGQRLTDQHVAVPDTED